MIYASADWTCLCLWVLLLILALLVLTTALSLLRERADCARSALGAAGTEGPLRLTDRGT